MGRHEILATWVALTILSVYWFIGILVRICKLTYTRGETAEVEHRELPRTTITTPSPPSQIIPEADFQLLGRLLDEGNTTENPWEFVLEKTGSGVSYSAKRREPKNGGPTEYLSTTVFQGCSSERLRDFYMDNEFRLQWDKTVVDHKQLDICLENGTEIGQTIKKFPLMTPREYVLAWRLWEGENKTFYCIIKACEHDRAPKQQKFRRVEEYFSAWRIQQVSGMNASEVKMFYSENIGMRREMAKMAFSRGIWSYICKMESNLRKYTSPKHGTGPNALTLSHKAPFQLEHTDKTDQGTSFSLNEQQFSDNLVKTVAVPAAATEKSARDSSRPISLLAQSAFMLGWAVFLGHGWTSLGGKLAAAVFMNKAVRRKHRQQQQQSLSSSRYIPKNFSISHQNAAVAAAAAASAAARRQMRIG